MTESAPAPDASGGEHLLFSYGTLRLPAVQRALFGGVLPTSADAVVGHVLRDVHITDPEVVAMSGSAVHPVLTPTPDRSARVDGVVLTLDDAALARADAYEVDAYRRVRVALASGRTAWVYSLAAAE